MRANDQSYRPRATDVLTVPQVLQATGLPRATLYRWMRAGRLRYVTFPGRPRRYVLADDVPKGVKP